MSDEVYIDLNNLKSTHKHEEDLRAQSLALIEANPGWKQRLIFAEKALALLFAYTHDYTNQSDDELTLQFLGIRLFNTGASALKLGLSGYCQQGFSLLRDVIEVGFLLDYFGSWPEKISEWKASSDADRMNKFGPKHIRAARAMEIRNGKGHRRKWLRLSALHPPRTLCGGKKREGQARRHCGAGMITHARRCCNEGTAQWRADNDDGFFCHSGTLRSSGPGIQGRHGMWLWIPGSRANARAPE